MPSLIIEDVKYLDAQSEIQGLERMGDLNWRVMKIYMVFRAMDVHELFGNMNGR